MRTKGREGKEYSLIPRDETGERKAAKGLQPIEGTRRNERDQSRWEEGKKRTEKEREKKMSS